MRTRRRIMAGPRGAALRRVLETGALFIHVPKCGGKSVVKTVYGLDEHDWFGHAPIRSYPAILGPSRFRDAFKFAMVRDPATRCLSGYRFLARGGFGTEADRAAQAVIGDRDFDAFVRDGALETLLRDSIVFLPQARFVTDASGRLAVDRLCAFERFDAEIAALPRGLGAGAPVHLNSAAEPAPDIAPETRARIAAIYDEDYAFFSGLGERSPAWALPAAHPGPVPVPG